jgi:hypothetical protein
MTTSDDRLRSELIKLADDLEPGSDGRLKILRLLTGQGAEAVKPAPGDFNPEEIAEVEKGPLEDEPDEPYMNDHFTQGEFAELGVKQEDGDLGATPSEEPAKLPAGQQEEGRLAADEATLFTGLVKLAYSDEEARGPVLTMLREGGYIDEAGKPTGKHAGCEKLPEGPMRDNCEKKKEEGGDKKDDKKDDKKAAVDESHLREGLIRLAHAKPEFRDRIVPLVVAYDRERMIEKFAQEFPGGFEGCVKHFVGKEGFKAEDPGDTKEEAARKLCAYIGREHGKIKAAAVEAKTAKEAAAAAFRKARELGIPAEGAVLAGKWAADTFQG